MPKITAEELARVIEKEGVHYGLCTAIDPEDVLDPHLREVAVRLARDIEAFEALLERKSRD